MPTHPTAMPYPGTTLAGTASSRSAVSWAAVIAGAVIAAATSAMLMIGGSGLGFLSVSPWGNEGVSGTTLAMGTIAWLFASQIIAYGVAGYITGRLRTQWTDTARDEVFFRDTAHGFLVWALSALFGLFMLGSMATSLVTGTVKAGAALTGAAGTAVASAAGTSLQGQIEGFSMDDWADTLLRPADPAQAPSTGDQRREVSAILLRSAAQGTLAQEDLDYLTRMVAHRAGIDENTARQRITELDGRARQALQQAEQQAKEAADSARKAAALFSLWAFAALLCGAFVASLAATMGGRARDA